MNEEEMLSIALKESMIGTARKEARPEAPKVQSATWEMSLTGEDFFANFEPVNAEDRRRIASEPVGLKNIGNSKAKMVNVYFSMLLQFNLTVLLLPALFHISSLASLLL